MPLSIIPDFSKNLNTFVSPKHGYEYMQLDELGAAKNYLTERMNAVGLDLLWLAKTSLEELACLVEPKLTEDAANLSPFSIAAIAQRNSLPFYCVEEFRNAARTCNAAYYALSEVRAGAKVHSQDLLWVSRILKDVQTKIAPQGTEFDPNAGISKYFSQISGGAPDDFSEPRVEFEELTEFNANAYGYLTEFFGSESFPSNEFIDSAYDSKIRIESTELLVRILKLEGFIKALEPSDFLNFDTLPQAHEIIQKALQVHALVVYITRKAQESLKALEAKGAVRELQNMVIDSFSAIRVTDKLNLLAQNLRDTPLSALMSKTHQMLTTVVHLD